MFKTFTTVALLTATLFAGIGIARTGSVVFTGSRGLAVAFVFENKSYTAIISADCQNAVSRNLRRSLTITWDGVFPSGGGAYVEIERFKCHLYSIR